MYLLKFVSEAREEVSYCTFSVTYVISHRICGIADVIHARCHCINSCWVDSPISHGTANESTYDTSCYLADSCLSTDWNRGCTSDKCHCDSSRDDCVHYACHNGFFLSLWVISTFSIVIARIGYKSINDCSGGHIPIQQDLLYGQASPISNVCRIPW